MSGGVIRAVTDSSAASGSRLSTGATRSSTPIAGSLRRAITCSRTSRIRSAGSDSPTGAAIVTPANLLPAARSSAVRRLTGSASGSSSTGTPRASWYRPRPPHRAARYASLTDPPTVLAAPRRSASGTSRTCVRVTRLRRRSSGDGGAGCGPSTRRADLANPIASATVGPGAPSRRSAMRAAPPSSFHPRARAVSGSRLRLARSRSLPVTSRGMGTGASGRGPGSRPVS